MPWWEQWPGVYDDEMKKLANAGIPFERDEDFFRAGQLRLRLRATANGNEIKLVAIYPDSYPYFRFEVYAPELRLSRHQNPFEGNLCLIGRSTDNWQTTDSLAEFLVERLPKVLQAANAASVDVANALEEHQGEPLTCFYSYPEGARLLIDSEWSIPSESLSGRLVVGLCDNRVHPVRGMILKIQDDQKNVLAQSVEELASRSSLEIEGRWVRPKNLPKTRDAKAIITALEEEFRFLKSFRGKEVTKGLTVRIVGCLLTEELSWWGHGDGWLFVVQEVHHKERVCTYLVRADRAGKSDLSQRVPLLSELKRKKIAVVGLGCLGSFSAMEFARNGIAELRVLDDDHVEAGTTVRWSLGIAASGLSKVHAISEFMKVNYPYTNVIPIKHRLGLPRISTDVKSDEVILQELLDGVDLVYDASAERGVQYFLSNITRRMGIPYVSISATEGAWGGRVVRITPTTQGCMWCFWAHMMDGRIPSPPQDPCNGVQPKGCADPTFTGASFDLYEIALSGVRLATSTLCVDSDQPYPHQDWDVMILSMRKEDGGFVPPNYVTSALERHPRCECH